MAPRRGELGPRAPTRAALAALATLAGCGARSELITAPRVEASDAGAPTSAVLLAAGRSHACARVGDQGPVRCWGAGLGRGDTSGAPSAINAVAPLPRVAALSAGADDTCVVAQDGRVLCWGANAMAFRAPRPPTSTRAISPVAVDGLAPARSVALGPRTFCAALRDGTARCWGENGAGMLGIGAFGEPEGIQTPVGLAGVARVVGGYESMGALGSDGAVARWGAWLYPPPRGRVSQLAPDRVADLPAATDVAMGNGYLCALGADGVVRCLGYNRNQALGDGTTDDRTTPVPVRGLPAVRALSIGFDHACAIATDGAVWCWGSNEAGKCGVSAASNSVQPTQVAGVTDAVAVAAGWGFTCAASANDEVRCWGNISAGTSGQGPAGAQHVPRLVGGL